MRIAVPAQIAAIVSIFENSKPSARMTSTASPTSRGGIMSRTAIATPIEQATRYPFQSSRIAENIRRNGLDAVSRASSLDASAAETFARPRGWRAASLASPLGLRLFSADRKREFNVPSSVLDMDRRPFVEFIGRL